jgi:MoaA/NifB/PqqE/SkfB family radical SAM enzyme
MIGKIIPKTYNIINIQNTGIDTDYYITFRINNKCNLKCEYCHWRSGNHYELKTILKTIDNIIIFSKLKNMNNITFYFHGGEPSFHPNIEEILKYIKEQDINIIVEFQTNLSLNNYQKLDKYIDFYDISFHYIELKKQEKIETFINNINNLPESKLLNLDIMLENILHNDQDEFYNLIKIIRKLKFVNSEMIYGFMDYNNNDKTEKLHKDLYKKYNKNEQQYLINNKVYNTNDLFKNGLNCKGMLCDAGKNTIVINGDGDMYICGSHVTKYITNSPNIKPFTNIIIDKQYIIKWGIIKEHGYICKWDYCGGDFYVNRKVI